MIFVDTGFYIALLDPRDSLHDRASRWVIARRENYLVTEYVLWETVNFASRTVRRDKVHALVRLIRSATHYEVIPASTTLFDAGLRLHSQRPDKNWSLTDCISFLLMNERGMTKALAHDEHFEQTGFEALLRREPTAE